MKISYNWLKQFLELDWEAEKTGELLTNLGLEVEGITDFESVKGGLKGIVVGHIVTCVQHPNADRLKLTTVDVGGETPLQIVCGAPNVAQGQKVPVAIIGTTLYTKEGETWQIKKGKIRGEESHGMICAEDELGLGGDHDGIMILDSNLAVGTPCSQVFEIQQDKIFEIGLTPNRSDAMSHYGVARDLKAGLAQQKIQKKLITPSNSNFAVDNRSLKIDVKVVNNQLAPRYCGLTISNILVQDSPDWLKNRLRSIGLAPINNVVDITNFVLHELGQPLHAFDASKIKGHKIEVKTLPKGTKFVTLDGMERKLHEEDLMICDASKPMCIAGVFGGLHSGVNSDTTSIFLESAYFDPISIRKTAKRHGLNTDASFRFERGIDINLTEYAMIRAALLIKEIAGGEISSDIVDLYSNKKEDFQVFLTFEKINKLIGQEIPRDTIKSILSSLEIKVNNITESGLGLTIPSYRGDVQREVDVIEEILRVYGYNNIDFNQKFTASVARTSKYENHILQNVVGDLLASKGFYEIMTNSLVAAENKRAEFDDTNDTVAMLNPLSADLSVLRTSMLYSGLETIRHNQNRQKQHLKFFEFGKTYNTVLDGHREDNHLILLATGNQFDENWAMAGKKAEFFFLKGIVSVVLQRLGITEIQEKPSENPLFSEGITLKVKKVPVAELGLVKKNIAAHYDIKSEVFCADFNWDAILKIAAENTIVFAEISKFPEVKRDFALLLDEHINYKEVHDLAFNVERQFLRKVNLFDVYTGEKLPSGKKSYAINFVLQDPNKTLTDKQIDKIMTKLQQAYNKQLGAELR